MKQIAVEWLENEISGLDTGMSFHYFEDKIQQAKVMEKEQRGYSKEEVKNIMAETWIQCVGSDGNNFKELRDKILKEFKNK
jgi:hypothetical protein